MKKTKIIVPALGVLLLSTAASVTGTVAWFSMNNFVTAEGMNVKAKAENGIVISNAEDGVSWKDSATSLHTSTLEVKPTSTATAATWVHSTSNDAADENTGNDYALLTTAVDSATGAGYVDENANSAYDSATDSVYYSMHSFYIKSSAQAITNTLYITNVKATLPAPQKSENLNKALRVLVKLNGAATAKVYSPVYAAANYSVATSAGKYDTEQPGAATRATVTPINASGTNGLIATASQEFLANQDIPANNDTPLRIDVYLYFEGEDPNCISDNLTATLDSINVSVTFGTQTKTAE